MHKPKLNFIIDALICFILSRLLISFPGLITPDIQARGRRGGGRRSQAGGFEARVAMPVQLAGAALPEIR
jgi:hypothetical protein